MREIDYYIEMQIDFDDLYSNFSFFLKIEVCIIDTILLKTLHPF